MNRETLVRLLADRVLLYGWKIEMVPETYRDEVEVMLNAKTISD